MNIFESIKNFLSSILCPPEIKIGSKYILDPHFDPFYPYPLIVTVLDIKEGWISYNFEGCYGRPESAPIKDFLSIYKEL